MGIKPLLRTLTTRRTCLLSTMTARTTTTTVTARTARARDFA
nr:MAG TPA: hypothetical protein [Caudoviricetes sp.]